MKNLLFPCMLLLLTTSGAVNAQSATETPDDRFRSVFDRFIGDDWLFHIEMFDADGNVAFSGVDVRRFDYGVGGAFLIENVFSLEDDAHIGIQLVGLNRKTGTIHLSTFFQWQPTALASVSGSFTESGGVEGTSSARLPDATEVKGRFSCDWVDERWTCSSWVIGADGTERIGDRNSYCRRADPDCGRRQ